MEIASTYTQGETTSKLIVNVSLGLHPPLAAVSLAVTYPAL
jgi:hypothetical protein